MSGQNAQLAFLSGQGHEVRLSGIHGRFRADDINHNRCCHVSLRLLDCLGLFKRLVNRTDHVEGLFGKLIAFTVDNHLKAANRFL